MAPGPLGPRARRKANEPSAGVWRYVVDDGFAARHDFAPVRVGAGPAQPSVTAASAEDDSGWRLPGTLAIASMAGLLAAAATLLLQRRRTRPAA